MENPIPADSFHYSTHTVSVAEAVEMARVMGRLPDRLLIYGIEGADFGSGDGLSPRGREICRSSGGFASANHFQTSHGVRLERVARRCVLGALASGHEFSII